MKHNAVQHNWTNKIGGCMTIALTREDFQELVRLLATLPEFRTLTNRVAFVTEMLRGSPRADDLLMRIDLDGNPHTVAVQVIELFNNFGQDVPGQEVLSRLINHLLEFRGGGNEVEFLRGLFARYPLQGLPIARSVPISAWHGQETVEAVNEKIIGENTLRDIAVLEIALEAAKAVVHITLSDGYGSGFMCAPNLLITNHHVLQTAEQAQRATFTFNYQLDHQFKELPASSVYARAGGIFYTSEAFDFTIVEVESPIELTPLRLKAVRAQLNDRVTIIQHPAGGYKKISMQNNFVQFANNELVQYTTSTLPGSSGSPVFDTEFSVIAIHHSGGMLLEPDSSTRYLRNEGISMVAVLKDVQQHASGIYSRLNKH
jgi:V8-like Glu-specific endopeptidase